MKRSYIALGAVGLALGGLWYAAGGSALATGRLRVDDPVVHDNLAVFFVRGPDEVNATRVVGLQEALERNWAVVHETGNVNTLVVENLSADHELFIQSGDIIKGGRQDRMIASDMLLSPASGRTPVGVHCVEQSRWSGRGTEAATHFAVSNSFAVGNSLKVANFAGYQGGVWENVKAEQDKLTQAVGLRVNAAASPTSFQLALENRVVQDRADEYRRALQGAAGGRRVVGAVFVVNGKVTSAEVYGSNTLFQKAWPKLLAAASVEALTEKAAAGTARLPSAQDVEQFLAAGGEPAGADASPAQAGDARGLTRFGRGEPQQEVSVEFNTLARGNATRLVAGSGGQAPSPRNDAHNPAGSQPLPEPAQTRESLQRAVNLDSSSSLLVDSLGWVDGRADSPARDQNNIRRGGPDPIPRPAPAAVNPDGNRLNTSRVETKSMLCVESRDPAKKVIHRSYIKK